MLVLSKKIYTLLRICHHVHFLYWLLSVPIIVITDIKSLLFYYKNVTAFTFYFDSCDNCHIKSRHIYNFVTNLIIMSSGL